MNVTSRRPRAGRTGSGYCYLAEGSRGHRHPEGEVQVLADLGARPTAARAARDRALPGRARPVATDQERREI